MCSVTTLPSVENGQVDDGTWEVGASRSISCNPGFYIGHPNYIICEQSGRWSQPGRCTRLPPSTTTTERPNYCLNAQLPNIRNGYFENGAISLGSVRRLLCNPGYLPSQPNFTVCDYGGWRPAGRCERGFELQTTPRPMLDLCSEYQLPWVANGHLSSGALYFGAVRYLQCNEGYSPTTPEFSRCQRDGTWSQPGQCEQAFEPQTTPRAGEDLCSEYQLPWIANGHLGSGALYFGAVRYLQCDQGYSPTGTVFSRCQRDGTWSQPGQCERAFEPQTTPRAGEDLCSEYQLPWVANGHLGSGTLYFGAVRYLKCIEGYSPKAPEFSRCQGDGTWSQPGQCVPSPMVTTATAATTTRVANCLNSQLPYVENGNFENGAISLGSVRSLICYPGYLPTQPNYTVCDYGGWRPTGGCERVFELQTTARARQDMCSEHQLPQVANGHLGSGALYLGAVRYLHCNQEYSPTVPEFSKCQSDGTWTQPGRCEIIQQVTNCEEFPLPHVENGRLEEGPSTLSSRRFVICASGFIRKYPDFSICESNGWTQPADCQPGSFLRKKKNFFKCLLMLF